MEQEHYLVVGLGITGYSVAAYLIKQGARVTVTDSREIPPKLAELRTNFPQIPLLLGEIKVPEDITIIVASPGIAISHHLPIIGDIELFAQVVDKPVLAITGSNGKSTVTTLLGEMAKASGIKSAVGGNLGVPALDLLSPNADCYILELSSFQLETLHSLKPLVVTLLNVSPDHMDRYADLTTYQLAKQRIFNNAKFAVFNRADALTIPITTSTDLKRITFGLDQPATGNYGLLTKDGDDWLAKDQNLLMPVKDMAMLGAHNVENALAALAMGEVAGFNMQAMLQTLTEFKGLEHRCEKILVAQDIVWVNDSKGTNVAATVAALNGLCKTISGQWVIILGGVGKNADFSPLIEPIRKYCCAAILIGEERQALWDLLHKVKPCYQAKDLPEVIQLAQQVAKPGDGVLLSPACASFDMFDNYMHRGELFKKSVLQWVGAQNAATTE
jgi:UDP-N-acetylmuramoylalanine--D-glutamate ligase